MVRRDLRTATVIGGYHDSVQPAHNHQPSDGPDYEGCPACMENVIEMLWSGEDEAE